MRKTVFRTDRGTLRKPERTAQGFLRVDGWVSRPGIYEYVNTRKDEADGFGRAGTIRRELRPDSEVLSAAAIAGYEGAPVTIGHPRKPDGTPIPVTSENVRQLEVGTVLAARQDGDALAADIVVKDAKAIKTLESGGKRETSPGYHIDVEKRSGVDPKYGRYDAVQYNVRINHLALVDHARGGSSMRLRMDECEGLYVDADDAESSAVRLDEFDRIHTHKESGYMDPQEQIRSLKAQLAETEAKLKEHETAVVRNAARADSADATVETLRKENGDLRAQIAAAANVVETEAIVREKLRADEAEAKVRKFDDAFDSAVKERVTLERRASVVMGPEFRMDGLAPRDIMATVVKRLDAQADTSTKVSDAFLAGRFESLIDLHARNARSGQRVADIITEHNVARVDEIDAKRKAYRERWREPLKSGARKEG